MRSQVLLVALAIAAVHSLPTAYVPSCGNVEGEQSNVELAVSQVMHSNLTFACDECFEMMQSLAGYCKHHTNSRTNASDFHHHCYEQTIGITSDFDTIFQKCVEFHEFVSTLFCPLDPCVQVTQSMVKAPRAVCDLMRCQTITQPRSIPGLPESFPPTVPLTCPEYMNAVIDFCKVKSADEPLSNASCAHFPERFQREGCHVVVSSVITSALPVDFCGSNECNTLPQSKFHEFCEHVLHLPPTDPVPAPSYLAWLESLKVPECQPPPGFGIQVTHATFGRNCSENITNNILSSVKSRCDGLIKCTYGNPDVPNSNWDPTEHIVSPSCTREFEIRYRCQQNGVEHTLVSDEETKFKAMPFDCMAELENRLQHDENFGGMTLARPRDVPSYL